MCDRDLRVAIEQERLTRRKHGITLWYEDPLKASIEYCLQTEGVDIGEVECFVSSDVLPARALHDLRTRPVKLFPHHLCHAASAYLMLPPGTKAAVLVYDGYGSIRGAGPSPLRNRRETFSFFVFDGDGFQTIGQTCGLGFIERDDFEIGVTNSIGVLYELVTSLLGYESMDSGKTMGLSSHGVPRYVDDLAAFIQYRDDPNDCFRCASDDPEMTVTIERILREGRNGFTVRADLAASVQSILNTTLMHCADLLQGHGAEVLCISGGCGLNTVANARLAQTGQLPVVVPPHCGDAGLAFGALWLEAFTRDKRVPTLTFRGGPVSPHIARPGRTYSIAEQRRAVQEYYPRLIPDSTVRTAEDLAVVLADGAIVGVLNGSSEIGPRALGGRSILADPRAARTREKINRQIKHREPFRPLAPIVLEEDYLEYFEDIRCADPFMLKIARATPKLLHDAPAAVHVDGTARVQIIPAAGDPFLRNLLLTFRRQSGVGILINTSFNRKGEPIVETPLDAVDAFLGMGLDGLYMNGEFYRQTD